MFNTLARLDFRHWPTAEAVTLIQGATSTPVPVAMRVMPRVYREKEPSGGRYLLAELTWQLPGPLLPAHTDILPGSVVRAYRFFRDGTAGTADWVATECDYNHVDEVWKLKCAGPFLAGGADAVTVQRPVTDASGDIALDTSAAEVVQWQDVYADEPAAVFFHGRADAIVDAQVGGDETWTVVLTRALEITARDRVLFGALVLDIQDYRRDVGLGEFPFMTCTRHP